MAIPIFKYGFYGFSALEFLVGAACVVLGSLFLTVFKHEFHFVHFSTFLVSIALIAIGSILIGLVVLGVFVAQKAHTKLASAHLFGLVLAFAALATLGVWGLTIIYNGDLESEVRAEINASIASYNQTDKANVNSVEIDWMQKNFHCCGLNSYDDWDQYISEQQNILSSKLDSFKSSNRSGHDVPDSCCKNGTEGCGAKNPRLDDINTDGCFQPFYQYLSDDLKILCGVACILAVLTLLANIFIGFVCYKTKGDYTELSQD